MKRRNFLLNTAIGGAMVFIPSPMLAFQNWVTTNYFEYGVASGDATQNSIILWTRVSDDSSSSIEVQWQVSKALNFDRIVASGTAHTNKDRDYTIKIDCEDLEPNTPYFYRFIYKNDHSVTGSFKTLPNELTTDIQLAIVSCNNYEDGYFNSFRNIANQEEISYVCHLGDYIYEYETLGYGNAAFVAKSNRVNDPLHEIVTLDDYRKRYKLYRSDKDLQLIHQKKAFYCMWDDHELANNAYVEGAKNHQPNEGDWEVRKQAALQAYFEWMPVRATNVQEMIRKVHINSDCQILFLEERLDGRSKQFPKQAVELNDETRKLISDKQFHWIKNNLLEKNYRWNIVMNQVMFTGYSLPNSNTTKDVDWWTGYPQQRNDLVNVFSQMENPPVIITGDHHQAHILQLKDDKQNILAYEFLTPSITSKNDDRLLELEVQKKQNQLYEHNPHVLYSNTNAHGYFILKVSKKHLVFDYRYTDTILEITNKEHQGPLLQLSRDNKLRKHV